MDLRPHDHGITYIELLANFQLVMGAYIPITVSRKGTVVFGEEFLSPKALILPKRSRSAIAQSVVLEAIVHQLEQAFSTIFFTILKRIGIKTLSHLGHYDLQKRTGFARRPQLLFQQETVTVVDAYLTECRNQNNFNLPLLTNRYIHELPRPIDSNLPSQFVDIHPGAVPYHRKKIKKSHKNTEMEADLQPVNMFICGISIVAVVGHFIIVVVVQIWMFHLVFLPRQRCWGRMLWGCTHIRASMVWKRWLPW